MIEAVEHEITTSGTKLDFQSYNFGTKHVWNLKGEIGLLMPPGDSAEITTKIVGHREMIEANGKTNLYGGTSTKTVQMAVFGSRAKERFALIIINGSRFSNSIWFFSIMWSHRSATDQISANRTRTKSRSFMLSRSRLQLNVLANRVTRVDVHLDGNDVTWNCDKKTISNAELCESWS